jgi:hypothetical protein
VNLVNDPATAILVSKSSDGGDSWSEPITLARDPSGAAPFLFNDKESITADPNDANSVYAVWDRTRFPSDRANFNAQHAFSFRGDAADRHRLVTVRRCLQGFGCRRGLRCPRWDRGNTLGCCDHLAWR